MSFYHLTENTNGNATYTSEKHNMAVEGTDTETGFSCVSTESNLQPEEEEDGGGYSSLFVEFPEMERDFCTHMGLDVALLALTFDLD